MPTVNGGIIQLFENHHESNHSLTHYEAIEIKNRIFLLNGKSSSFKIKKTKNQHINTKKYAKKVVKSENDHQESEVYGTYFHHHLFKFIARNGSFVPSFGSIIINSAH